MNVIELPFEKLVEQYEPLIKSEIKKLYKYELYDELYQVAMIALWEAQQNFDSKKGFFASFAQKYVKGRLRNFLKREQKYADRTQTYLEPEMIENIPALPYEKQVAFPTDRIEPYLSPNELLWFVEFYENNKGPTAIAKKHNVTVDQVKHWRKQTLKKIQSVFTTSDLLALKNSLLN